MHPGRSGTSAAKPPPSSSGSGSKIIGPAMGFCSGLHSHENASRRRKTLGIPMGADICVQTESLARTYERPALRKLLAAFPADSKVVKASFAVIATVVSISDKLPPAAAASIAEAAVFSSGNSPMASQSWWPKVKYHPMRLPPTLLKSLATASSRFFGLASMTLTAAAVKRPQEMYIGMASLLKRVRVLDLTDTEPYRRSPYGFKRP